MPKIIGLTGLRPVKEAIEKVVMPPYDVVKSGSPLEAFLKKKKDSLYHVLLGEKPKDALEKMVENGLLAEDYDACFYVYEQRHNNSIRTGVLLAGEVSDYSLGKIIRHEKTFPKKVYGRVKLRRETGFTFGPVFCLTKTKLNQVLKKVVKSYPVTYEFTSDFGGFSDLDGIKSRVFRVPEKSEQGLIIKELISAQPLYIADGHHRYQAALELRQKYFLAYVTDQATILAYNRLINGPVKFRAIKDKLELEPAKEFKTPPRHNVCLYSEGMSYLYRFRIKCGMTEEEKCGMTEEEKCGMTEGVVGRLDVAALEREVYPLLGIKREMIRGGKYIKYRPESQLKEMKDLVDQGKFDLAIALHPVGVAD